MKTRSSLLILLFIVALFGLNSCQKDNSIRPIDFPQSEQFTDFKKDPNIALTSLTEASCVVEDNDHLCTTVDLIAGQHYVVGVVKVYCIVGTDEYKVVYEITAEGCSIEAFHLYAGPESDIPKTTSGNPKVGHFPFADGGLSAKSVCVYIGSMPDMFTIAAHAVVSCDGKCDAYSGTETAWADGKSFPGNNWATCFDVDCKKQ